MDLTAKPYRIFVRVAELKSFSRAAEALNMSQPALSALLSEFERQLGFPLFRRSSRKVELSPQGTIYLDYARRMVLEAQWANQTAEEIRSNRLRIGVAHHTGTIGLRTRLTDSYMLAHPDVPIAIRARHPRQLAEDLDEGVIDIAITLEITDPPYGSVVEKPARPESRIVLDTRPVTLAVPSGHALLNDSSRAEPLAGERVATISRVHGIAVSEGLAHALSAAGASIVHPPEGDAQSVLRYAAMMGVPAIDLGWFERPAALTALTMPWPVATALVVLSSSTANRPSAAGFLDHARRLSQNGG